MKKTNDFRCGICNTLQKEKNSSWLQWSSRCKDSIRICARCSKTTEKLKLKHAEYPARVCYFVKQFGFKKADGV